MRTSYKDVPHQYNGLRPCVEFNLPEETGNPPNLFAVLDPQEKEESGDTSPVTLIFLYYTKSTPNKD